MIYFNYIQKLFLLAFLSGASLCLFSQERILSLENTMDVIRSYHPVFKQAGLEVELAKSSLQASRGVFDPSFYMRNEKKTFDGKNYFSYANPELKIPTWFGIDLKGGFENNVGDRLDPMFTAGKSTYAGVSIPLLKGLLYDKRRAAVQQSKMMVKYSMQERLLTINDLLYDAADIYWKWVSSYQNYRIVSELADVTNKRFEFVKSSFISGDRAAIDTIEALSQIQNVLSMQAQSWFELQKHRLLLSNFLWSSSGQPFELSEDIVPDSSWRLFSIKDYPLPSLEESLTQASQLHPKLTSLDIKQDVLGLEKRYKFQNLLPTLDLNYNFLNKGYALGKPFNQPLFENNFKYGFQLGMPLFQRASRGEYSMAKIKIADLNLHIQQTRLEIENKVRASYNEVIALQSQAFLFQQNANNQELLLKAEEVKFSIGESSMFLVNARENKLLETQQKMNELKTKFFKSLIGIAWSTGQLK